MRWGQSRTNAGQPCSGIDPDVKIDKVNNVWGSTAGAGSDFFHIYRRHRHTEMERLKKLDAEHEQKVSTDEFNRKREILQKIDEERTRKKRNTREKKRRKRELKRLFNCKNETIEKGSSTEVTQCQKEVATSL